MTRLIRRILITLALAVFTAACSNSLYKVKPYAKLPPMPDSARSADLGSISFRAAPLLLDEESQELFEANLHLAGLLPVRVEITHNSGDVIELKKVKFRVLDGSGTEWKAVSGKKAIGRILDANGVYAYNPNSKKTFEKEFRAYELNLKTPLTHDERLRSGFIFFQGPKKAALESPRGLQLIIEGLGQPATIGLN